MYKHTQGKVNQINYSKIFDYLSWLFNKNVWRSGLAMDHFRRAHKRWANINGWQDTWILNSRVDRCCTIPGLCACNSSSSSSSSSSHEIPFLETESSEWLLSWAAVGLERMVVCKLYAVLVVGGVLPHVVCGCRVLDRREEEGKTLQTVIYLESWAAGCGANKNHPITEKCVNTKLHRNYLRNAARTLKNNNTFI